MSIDISLLTFAAFLGDQQSQSPLLLSEIFSPGGSQNLWVDRLGQIRPIDGYSKQTASPLTTNTGGSTAIIRSMFPYKKTAGGSVTRQVLGVLDDATNEWELWYTTDLGVNWTFISDRGATPVGQDPDWVQFGDILYVTVPKTEVPRQWDGTTMSATGGTQLAAPTIVDAAVAGNLSGVFQWRIVPVLNTGREKVGSVVSAVKPLTLTQADVTWVADADTNVKGYNAYRTTGIGKIFYLSTYVDGRTTVTFRDNVSDLSIIRQQFLDAHGDAPPSGVYYCFQHKGRVWWGRTDADPRKWFWSDPGLADSVWQDRNFVDCSNAGDDTSMGDVSTGGTGEFNGVAVIWLEKSVWIVSGDGQVVGAIINWNLRRTDAQVGTVSHRSVVRVPAGAKYLTETGSTSSTSDVTLAYFTPFGDIRLFDGNNDTIISNPKKTTLMRLSYASRGKVHQSHDTARNIITWYLPVDGGTTCTIAVAWDYNSGLWYEWTTTPFASVITTDSSSAAQTIMASQAAIGVGGYVYQLWNGNNFDGSVITGSWMTKPIYASRSLVPGADVAGSNADFTRVKRHRFVDFLFAKIATTPTITVSVYAPDALDTDAALFSTTVVGSSRVRAALQDSSGRFHHDRGLRLKFQGAVSTGPWTLVGAALGFQVLLGLNRPS